MLFATPLRPLDDPTQQLTIDETLGSDLNLSKKTIELVWMSLVTRLDPIHRKQDSCSVLNFTSAKVLMNQPTVLHTSIFREIIFNEIAETNSR